MDRRDAMAMSGSAAFYMQRGNQSGLDVSSRINQLANTAMPFQSNIGPNSMGSTLQMETSTPIPQPAMQSQSEPVKRKRGRPRKYGTDGTVSLALSPSLSTHPGTISPTQKRGRGRPPGTGRKQQLASFGMIPLLNIHIFGLYLYTR